MASLRPEPLQLINDCWTSRTYSAGSCRERPTIRLSFEPGPYVISASTGILRGLGQAATPADSWVRGDQPFSVRDRNLFDSTGFVVHMAVAEFR